MEINEPTSVSSAEQLLQLHPSQISWLTIRLTALGDDPVQLSLNADEGRLSLQDMVEFARRMQPEGTTVEIWFRGRSEQFMI